MSRVRWAIALACALAGAACTGRAPETHVTRTWSDTERTLLATLRLSALPEPPPDPGNRSGDDPRAAALGAALFADPALSRDGRISCQTCHLPERAFSDGRARSVGLSAMRRNAPSLLDVAYQRWLFWDGRADSLWSQALGPLEHPEEMGTSRTAAVHHVASQPRLAELYQNAFGPLPAIRWSEVRRDAGPLGDAAARAAWSALAEADRTAVTRAFANLGKAIAAHERTLRSRPTRFDAYVEAVLADRPSEAARQLDEREVAGLAVFVSGRSGCVACHHGPLFTDGGFHNIGTGDLGTANEDFGRGADRQHMSNSEFNCSSPLNDVSPAPDCARRPVGFGTEVQALQRGAFRTPGLRNLSATAPYLHDGRFASLEEVLEYYRHPPDKAAVRHELPARLDLSDRDVADLARFLRALDPS
jgi:cytochrome c peroxidase